MTAIQLVLASVAAGAILLIVLGLASSRGADPVRARLDQLGTGGPRNLEELELQEPLMERLFRPIAGRLAAVTGRITSAGSATRVQRRLTQAGNPGDLGVPEWMSVRLVLGFVGGGVLFLVFQILGAPITFRLAAIALGGIAGYTGPEMWLTRRIKARQHQILKALPDTLDLLSLSMRAGVGFDMALTRVTQRIPGPLSNEFLRALGEMRLGRSRRDVLRDIVPRTEVRALTNFIGALIQAEELGVPIAKVLDVQAQQLRIERRQRAEEMAAKAPIKMLFPLVGCILPAMFIVILGPAIIAIVKQLSGSFL